MISSIISRSRGVCRARSLSVVVRSPVWLDEIENISPNLPFPRFLMKRFSAPELRNLTAVTDGMTGQDRTFGEVYERTFQVAALLKKNFQISSGNCVGIMSPNHMDFFPSFHGIALAGGFSTTINPLYTPDEVSHQIEITGAKVLFVHPLCLDRAKEVAKKHNISLVTISNKPIEDGIPCIDDLINQETFSSIDLDSFVGGSSSSATFDSSSLLTVPFSSGTTGRPKGVMLTHRNLTVNVLQGMEFEGKFLKPKNNDMSSRGTLLVPLPFFHIYGMLAGMCLPLYAGGRVILMPNFDLMKFLEIIQTYRVTRAHIVPPIALALAKHPVIDNYDLSSLECLMSGAAPLGADVQLACANRLKCLVKQAWGMTETSPCGTITPDDQVANMEQILGKSGLLVPNTEAKIIDPMTGEDFESHQEGEIMIRGPQVMKGYFRNPEATRATIREDGWMHTGDIGKFDANGWMQITDRSKELIKYKGFQVPPAELEALILSMPQVKDVIVIPVMDEEAGELPRAYVVRQDHVHEDDFHETHVLEYVAQRVAPHKKLRGGVKFAKAVPKSASGKLLRRVQIQIDRGHHPAM